MVDGAPRCRPAVVPSAERRGERVLAEQMFDIGLLLARRVAK